VAAESTAVPLDASVYSIAAKTPKREDGSIEDKRACVHTPVTKDGLV
jgi:hypothetical protein